MLWFNFISDSVLLINIATESAFTICSVVVAEGMDKALEVAEIWH